MRRDSRIPIISSEYFQRYGKWAWLSAIFMVVYLSSPAQAAEVRVLQGEMVRLKLHNVLTTENVEKGDQIDFDVAGDVVVATHVVIQKGAPGRGKVVRVKGAGKRKVKDASVTFIFVSVRTVDGQDIPLRASSEKQKKADAKENEIEADDTLPGYAERVIGAEKGTVYVAYVDSSTSVGVPDVPVAAPPITPVAPAPANPAVATQPAAASGLTPAAAASSTTGATLPAQEEEATVNFDSNPAGADILIDGNLVGNTPSALHVGAGRHVIQLRIGGYRSWTRTMVVEPGSYPSIRATLEKQ